MTNDETIQEYWESRELSCLHQFGLKHVIIYILALTLPMIICNLVFGVIGIALGIVLVIPAMKVHEFYLARKFPLEFARYAEAKRRRRLSAIEVDNNAW